MGKKMNIHIHISYIIAAILSWFLFDWQIALIITILASDIRYKN